MWSLEHTPVLRNAQPAEPWNPEILRKKSKNSSLWPEKFIPVAQPHIPPKKSEATKTARDTIFERPPAQKQ